SWTRVPPAGGTNVQDRAGSPRGGPAGSPARSRPEAGAAGRPEAGQGRTKRRRPGPCGTCPRRPRPPSGGVPHVPQRSATPGLQGPIENKPTTPAQAAQALYLSHPSQTSRATVHSGRSRRVHQMLERAQVVQRLTTLDPPRPLPPDRLAETDREHRVEVLVGVLQHRAQNPVQLVR